MRTVWTSERDSAFRLCEQALEIDPQNVRALSHLSFKFTQRFSFLAGPDPQADLRRADELASLAIKIDPGYHMAHAAKGDALQVAGRYREAIDSYGRALMLAPSSILLGLPMAYNLIGEPEQAIAYADKAMRLSPHAPGRHVANILFRQGASPSACCRTMSRRLYGLSGLKLLLPRFCSWDLCGLHCLPWRAKRTRRAQQCSAIWRTTMPLSGPCLNGMLGSQKNRCRPIIRLFLRVFLY